jgi:chromosome segregation protein
MRLTKIYLAGFKSFVDPTTIPLIGNLTSIVGPNGCGKSNIIDAIRWVMGESSAKQLRGGSLTDVIFSGSTARKPVGQAVVELTFDNSDGSLGGEYANYAELAIRRVVTRDGQSNYYFNGTRCRRRDITDIFLGTGMGPRSYAIIEQGMISRFIEAKPDEFRVFLEEAAGISLYKERRKETENRIRHTRDNLARLADLRDELGRNLNHLEKQAEAAVRYAVLRDDLKEKESQHCTMAWFRLNSDISQIETTILEGSNQLAACVARAQSFETKIEKERLVLTEVQEAHQEVQKHFYDLGTQIAKLEQSIEHHQARLNELQEDEQQTTASLDEINLQLAQDQSTLQDIETRLETIFPEYEKATLYTAEVLEQLQQYEEEYELWREKFSDHHQEKSQPVQQAEVEKTKIAHLEGQITQAITQCEKLKQERTHLVIEPVEANLNRFKLEEAQLVEQLDALEDELQNAKSEHSTHNHQVDQLNDAINEKQSTLQQLKGQQSSLKALQESALSKQNKSTQAWQAEMGLSEAKRLAEILQVKSGYEVAVETILAAYLDGICVANDNALQDFARRLPEQLNQPMTLLKSESDCHLEGGLLDAILNPVALPLHLAALLSQVNCVTDLRQAFEQIETARPEQRFLTPEGILVAKGWVWVSGDKANPQAGVLAREQALKEIEADIETLEMDLIVLKEQLAQVKDESEAFQQGIEQINAQKQKWGQQQGELKGKIHAEQHRYEHLKRRIAEIEQSIDQSIENQKTAQEALFGCRERLEASLESMAVLNEQFEALQISKDSLQVALKQVRDMVKQAKDQEHQLALEKQKCETLRATTIANVTRNESNLKSLESRLHSIAHTIEDNRKPLDPLKLELSTLLELRIDSEKMLQLAKDRVHGSENQLEHFYQSKSNEEKEANNIRESLESKRLSAQTLKVHRETQETRAKEMDIDVNVVFKSLPEEASEESWAVQVEKIEKQIQRLGPINLAAIEEHKSLLERKTYLDAQNADLDEALMTLENAIKKIDKETRQKFKETFDKVNDGFKLLFPKLFGGGQAQLELTGEDLLETGVVVIARPPGKRNSTIQQLSGGEKALTAVALVFSIFQLNPAPFCLLDEVDAPLDDNNVGRFCELVKEMSHSLQFIFISHNKVAMEMAEQLQGVTMREPGVSRLVSVDIEAAASMVQG